MDEFVAYFNGDWVKTSEVKISPFDRGFTMGDVVFDVERTFDGKLFRLGDHLDRLYRSLQYARIDPGLTKDEMAELTEEVARRNEPMRAAGGDLLVRQAVTRGSGSSSSVGGLAALTPTVMNMAFPIELAPYAEAYDKGASVVFPSARSYSSTSLDPKVKHYSRGNFVQAQLQAADLDPDAHPVLLDQDGNISENIAANLFIVTDGVIRTPRDQSILQGISRMVALELAEQLGISAVEEDLQPYDAYTADEAFLSNSIYQLLPVRTIDKREVRQVPGPIIKQLLAAWSELVGVDIVDQAQQQARQ